MGPSAFQFLRAGYGVLLLGTLLMALPQSRRFFVSERWGGYGRSAPLVDAIQNPALVPWIIVLWLGCALGIIFDFYGVACAFINLLLCRYFFISMRWRGVLRGMGAPGFMTYWLAAAVFFLGFGSRYDASGDVFSYASIAFRVDFALIMLSAGTYKLFAGYARNHGMELGMVNPWWGYWWRFYQRRSPDHWIFKTLNHLAWTTEVVAAVLMLIPATRLIGAALIFVSFTFIATHIRLGFLCEMVMLSTLLFIDRGSAAERFLQSLWPQATAGPELSWAPPPWMTETLGLVLLAYVVLLPLAHAGLYYNFFARRALPSRLQRILERYTNFFGIILWRVFTIDVINFFVRIHQVDQRGARREYTSFGDWDWASRFRYNHVGEFVCFASLFTTLKYYPSNRRLFEERLLRYARTIPTPPGGRLVFEYFSIKKTPGCFDFLPVREFLVDPASGCVDEKVVEASVDVCAADEASPVHEGDRPGSYAPLHV
jgi:hypothetical protein